MKLRLLFAAGGTGGHLFPAMAVAERCKSLHPEMEIEFVGTKGKLEEQAVPRAGYPLNFLWISGFERSLSLKTLILPAKIGVSIAQSLRILSRFKPHAVVCAGAYVSYPIGLAASMRGIPLVLMESNALPGLVVRKLAPRASTVHVAFEETAQLIGRLTGGKVPAPVSGNPVRAVFSKTFDRAEARRHFGLDPERTTLFAVGGSLGARSINNALDVVAPKLIEKGMQIVWQTGKSYTGGERREERLYRSTFVHEMELAYAAADLVLARAGATTISELQMVGKASVLVPLPTAADDHQRKNAMAMESEGAARMLLDADLGEKLQETIERLIADVATLDEMGKQAHRLARPDADDRIAKDVIANATKRGRTGP